MLLVYLLCSIRSFSNSGIWFDFYAQLLVVGKLAINLASMCDFGTSFIGEQPGLRRDCTFE